MVQKHNFILFFLGENDKENNNHVVEEMITPPESAKEDNVDNSIVDGTVQQSKLYF